MSANGINNSGVLKKTEVAAWLPILLGVIATVVAVVLWVTSALEGKASTARVEALEARQGAAEIASARRDERQDADLAWIKSALWALTQRAGVVVTPPPGGNP